MYNIVQYADYAESEEKIAMKNRALFTNLTNTSLYIIDM